MIHGAILSQNDPAVAYRRPLGKVSGNGIGFGLPMSSLAKWWAAQITKENFKQYRARAIVPSGSFHLDWSQTKISR